MGWNLSQGYSSGGSQNTGWSISNASSMSGTDAMSARQWSAMMADIAWQRDMEAFNQQMAFNAEEAQKQRDWQEQMANTVYTRSVKNMREAGINPILAANMGLSGAAVSSGATASVGGAPSAPLAQSFMDSWSASNSMGQSESQGSSWNSSENGLITALSALGNIVSGTLATIAAGNKIDIAVNGLENLFSGKSEDNKFQKKQADDAVKYNKYSSPNYPHMPGSLPGTGGDNMKMAEKIKNFVQGLFD